MRYFVLCLLAITAASAYDVSEESSFELPADWASIRSNIDTSFSCIGRAYGYYADVANDCQLYHVCQPRLENDVTVYRHDPFICPLTTVFDQRTLSCIHSSPDFSCVDSVQYYADTENHYANMVPVEHHVVVSNEVAPPVNEHVSYEPAPVVNVVHNVVNPVVSEVPVAPFVDAAPEVPVAPVLNAEVPVARSTNSDNHPVVSHESSEVNVHHNEAPVVPVVMNSTPVVPVVRSNSEFYHQRESAEVNHVLPVVPVVHHPVNPLPNRMMQQNQENLVMEPVRKGFSPVKRNVYRPIVKAPIQQQLVEQPVKAPVQQQLVEQPVKAPVQQQLVEQPVKSPVKAPIQQLVQHPVKAPVQQQLVEQPVKSPVKAPVQQLVHYPIKAPVQQQLVEQPVKSPVKAPIQQQLVHQPIKAPVQQQLVEQPVKSPRKSIVRQTQQFVEVPRKSNGPVRQETSYMMRSNVPQTYYYNGQPSWRHHYYRLRPHLVSTRWV